MKNKHIWFLMHPVTGECLEPIEAMTLKDVLKAVGGWKRISGMKVFTSLESFKKWQLKETE